jgi:hypothetical protein
MAEKQGVPLDQVENIPGDAAERLRSLWITTAEELIAASLSPGAISELADYLQVSPERMQSLVDAANVALPEGSDFAPEEVEEFGLGALDEPGPEDEERLAGAFDVEDLPTSVNYLDQMPPVRNQGHRGTCVAHAGAAIREYLFGAPKSTQADLSEQFLYCACKSVDGIPEVEGTYISVAMERLQAQGICSEQTWPYVSDDLLGNEGQCPPPDGAAAEALNYVTSGWKKIPARSVQDIKQALADGFPVAFGVPVYRYWQRDPVRRTGDIRLSLTSDVRLGGHAMCMVGYEDDDTVPGGGYFLVRNSWGTGWGADSAVAPGYCRIPYEYISREGRSAAVCWLAPVQSSMSKKAREVDE